MQAHKANGNLTEDRTVVMRRYTPSDNREVLRIFQEGMMEMVADTAFRGLLYHPESQLLYAAVTGKSFSFKSVLFVER